MSRLVALATWLLTACTIDPVARAELTGEATGDAIFQEAGTSGQVSFQLTLAGPDGTYSVQLAAGACGAGGERWGWMGEIVISGGTGTMRGVTDDWSVASGEANDVVGRALVVETTSLIKSCGEIFNSD